MLCPVRQLLPASTAVLLFAVLLYQVRTAMLLLLRDVGCVLARAWVLSVTRVALLSKMF